MLAATVQARGYDAIRIRPSTQKSSTGASTRPLAGGDRLAVRVLCEPITAELAQRVFGATTGLTLRGWVDAARDVVADDRVLVTAGPHAGSYRIQRCIPPARAHPNATVELGLETTSEALLP